MEKRKLFRSRKDRFIAGICGGLGDFLNVDSNVIRLVWTLVVIFTGFVPGVLFYLIAIFILPEEKVVQNNLNM